MEQLEEALMRRAKEEDRRESNPVVLDVKVRENGVMMSMRMTMMLMFVYLTRKAEFFLGLSPK